MTFVQLAGDYLDDLAERHPDHATSLGDHRYDDRLPELTRDALEDERRALDRFAERLAASDAGPLTPEDGVDAALLEHSIRARAFELDELREHTWDPLLANPGRAIYLLLARDFAPLEERLTSVAGRLAGVPGLLAAARRSLQIMPNVHVETAISQFTGTIAMVTTVIDGAMDQAPACREQIERVRPAALQALAEHRDWLKAKLSEPHFADPRIGQERFARKLSLTLHAAADADAILARAEADLARVTEQITELAAELGGTPREVLDRLAADAPDESTILRFCADALAAQTRFVAAERIATLYDDPVEMVDARTPAP